MISYSFDSLSLKEKRKIVNASVVPRPIAWISTQNSDYTTNLAPFSYFSVVSPTTLSVSVQRVNEQYKDTTRNILTTKEAVIHIPSFEWIEAMDITSEALGINESEVLKANLNLVDSHSIRTQGIKEAKIRFETKVDTIIPIYDSTNTNVEADLIILRIQYVHLEESIYDSTTGYINTDVLQSVSRLGGVDYGRSEKLLNIRRKF